jgi:phospholipase C
VPGSVLRFILRVADHVKPPSTNVPSPDGISSTDDPFDFTRLGIRVPTVIVSPYVPKGTVVHAAPEGESQYEHSSIPATVIHKLLKPATKAHRQPEYLNARDAWAKTFEGVFSETVPRTDTPVTLVEVPSHRELYPKSLPKLDGNMKITEFQQTLVMLAAAVSKDKEAQAVVAKGAKAIENWTENEAITFIEPRVDRFINDESEDGAF